jgi:hypothetical protein
VLVEFVYFGRTIFFFFSSVFVGFAILTSEQFAGVIHQLNSSKEDSFIVQSKNFTS